MSIVFGKMVDAEIVKREPPHEMPQVVVVVTFRDKMTGGGRIEFDLTEGAVEILRWIANKVDDDDLLEQQAEWQEEYNQEKD